MKAAFGEVLTGGRRLVQRLTYGAVHLKHEALLTTPELHFRKDDRAPLEIVIAKGFMGREFSGCPIELSMYIQLNTPKVGYSGCPTLQDSMAWNLEVAESVGRKKDNPPPQNIYVSMVDPTECQLVWVPRLVMLNNIGFMTDSAGCKIQILDENGKFMGFENKYVPENELLILGSIPSKNIVTCIDKEDHERLRDNQAVLNRMFEHNNTLIERVRAKDLQSYTSLMLAFMQAGKLDGAKALARKVTPERVRAEATKHGVEHKHTEMMLSFLKATHHPEQSAEVFTTEVKCKQ